MSQITTYNLNYFDDYVSSGNGDKNYLRILFKPGYSVQVREVNQIQSILQDQINRLGSTVWRDNSAVIGGETTYLDNVKSVVLEIPDLHPADSAITYRKTIDYGEYIEYPYTFTINGTLVTRILRAKIIGTRELTTIGPRGNKQVRFYLQYENSVVTAGTNIENITEFDDFSSNKYSVILKPFTSTELSKTAITLYANSVGVAFGLSCAKGVFYTKGSFVMTPQQTIYVDKSLSEVIDGYAVLLIQEKVISAFDDNSLFDNAAGTPNFSAPGADRYQIDLSLQWITRSSFDTTSNSYIKLLSIEKGRPKEVFVTDKYTEINNVMAQRTREESGNYTLNPFPLTVRELFNGDDLPATCIKSGIRYTIKSLGNTDWANLGAGIGATIGTTFIATKDSPETTSTGIVFEEGYQYGIYKANDLDFVGYTVGTVQQIREAINGNSTIIGAKDQYNITLEPSIAYVDGNRVELKSPLNIQAPKARSDSHVETTALSLSADIGNYFIGSFTGQLPNIGNVTATYTLKKNTTDIGSCKIRSVEPISGSSMYRCYIYDVSFVNKIQYRFDDITSITSTGFTFTIDAAQRTLNQTEFTSGYFKLPYDTAKAINKVSYSAKQYFTGNISTGGQLTVSLTQPNAQFVDFDNSIIMVGGDIFTYGSGNNNTWRYSGTNTAISKTISNIENKWIIGETFHIISPIIYNNAAATPKTIDIATETITLTDANRLSIFKLRKPDVLSVQKIVYGTDINSGKDITSMFELYDDGQRDDHYTNARIKYTGNDTISSSITVRYTYFKRGANGNKFYTVNSYQGIDRSNIPAYGDVFLSDVIDFRPDLVYDIAAGGQDATSLIVNNGNTPLDPNTVINLEAEFYQPRIDKVVAFSNNSFSIVTGIPSFNPSEPDTPGNAMALYTLGIPAYTANIKDITVNYIDNRRYTMRDIGAIEKRIKNIEYYTSLSLLERSATEKSIFDTAGERFKNGILVDSFLGHSVGDVFNKNYNCAVDKDNGILRPRFNTNNIDLQLTSPISGSNTLDSGKLRIHHSIITLNYTEVPLVSQLKATDTISVQPHIIAKIEGNILLSPSSDNWKDTKTRPDLIVQDDAAFDAIKFIAEQKDLDILGTDFKSWKTVKSNVVSKTTNTTVQKIPGPNPKKPNVNRKEITTTEKTTVTKLNQSRTGTNTTLTSNTVTQSLGEFIREINVMPFMRSRRVFFHATGFLPSTKLYPFFDGQDISAYTHQLDAQFFKTPKEVDEETIRTYENLIPKSTDPKAALPLNLSGMNSSTGKFDSDLITNENGELYGSFIIPNNSQLKFRTGERIFKLTDDKRNVETNTNTFGFATYVANGLSEVRQEAIISTKKPVFNVQSIKEDRVVFDTNTTVDVKEVVYKDPLAQSFVIDSATFKEGTYVTSVELYFSQKAPVAPVQIAILTMVNGYPSNNIIPYSVVTLPPSAVNVSEDASASTKFTFINPVFLKSNDEYCLYINSRDLAYKCHYAILGNAESNESNALVAKQEYLGVFFTSSNSQTWTAYQDRDLKFKINRANFSSSSGELKFQRKLHTGIDKISLDSPGYGYSNPPLVVITPNVAEPQGAVIDTATATAEIDPITNKVKNIIITKRGSGYTLPPVVTLNAITGDNGRGAKATASLAQVPVSIYSLRQSSITPNFTAITNKISFGGNDDVIIKNNDDNYVPSSYLIDNTHIIENAIDKNVELTSILSTTDPTVSPVIDLDGTSLITVNNIINNNDKNEGVNVYENSIATAGNSTSLTDNKKSWIPDYWSVTKPSKVKIISGAGAGKEFVIIKNTTDTLYFNSQTGVTLNNTSVYSIVDNIATENLDGAAYATNGTTDSLEDTSKNWIDNIWTGNILRVIQHAGVMVNKETTITSNDNNTLVLDPALDFAINNTTKYLIVDKNRVGIDGAAQARYITRKVELNNPSDQLNIYISTNRPTSNTDIKVYVKLGYDSATADDMLDWEIVNPTGAVVPISSDPSDYREVEYIVNPITDFISFQVKIVLLSDNIIEIPTVRDFRAIATI